MTRVLELHHSALKEAHIEPLLRLAPRLQALTLRELGISNEIRQRLREAFGDKVYL